MNVGAAQAWFVAGTITLMIGGGLHALLSLMGTARYIVPRDHSVKSAMEGTRLQYGGSSAPSMWRAWLGFNISHGLGAFTFGLLCLLIATHDFKLVEEIAAIRPLTIAVSAAYIVLSLRFWYYGPAIITGTATACFTIATVLSA
ncbi:MAG: LIC_13387 family protein [Geodermatophilaceae bacterium]